MLKYFQKISKDFMSKMVQYHSTMSKKQYTEKYFSLFFEMQENILHFNKYNGLDYSNAFFARAKFRATSKNEKASTARCVKLQSV